MKQELDPESRKSLITYRLQRAYETYEDAVSSFERGSLSSSMNRLYYACFYAVLALLTRDQIEARTHEGVKRVLGVQYIVPGILDIKYGRYFSQILQARIQGDYDDFFTFSKETCSKMLDEGKEFIATIENLINRN